LGALLGHAFSFTATLGGLGGETKSKLLYEIVADTAASSQNCPLAQTHAYRRASQAAPLSTRAVARRYQHLATVPEDSVGTPAPLGRFSFLILAMRAFSA
jgi:hypothetical protein